MATPPTPAQQLNQLEKFLEQDPKNPRLLVKAIDTALAMGDIAAARKHANSALEAHPGDPFMRHRHGNVLVAEGKLDDAAVIFSYLWAKYGDANVAYNLGLVRFRQRKYDAAFKAVTPITPKSLPQAVALAVRALHYQGKVKEARALFETAPHANDPEVLAVASLVYVDDSDIATAETLAKKSLQGGRRELEALVAAGTAALTRKDAKDAQTYFKEALGINANDPRTLAGMGMAHLLAGDAAKSMKFLERAQAQMPEHPDTLEAMGWAHAMAGEFDKAEEVFKRMLAKGDGDARRGLAVTYALKGNVAEARMTLAHLKQDDDAALVARTILDRGTKVTKKLGQLAKSRSAKKR